MYEVRTWSHGDFLVDALYVAIQLCKIFGGYIVKKG